MKVAAKYANQRFAGMNMMTLTSVTKCHHLNGWYATVPFWIFSKRVFICSDCGDMKVCTKATQRNGTHK
jgi:hypothetical protein